MAPAAASAPGHDAVVVTVSHGSAEKRVRVRRADSAEAITRSICVAFGLPVGSSIGLDDADGCVVAITYNLFPGQYSLHVATAAPAS